MNGEVAYGVEGRLVGAAPFNFAQIVSESKFPKDYFWCSVAYGNDKFVATNRNSSRVGAYSTDGVNYHSSVLVRAENKEQAEKIAIDKAKVKPHADSSIIVVERDEDFVKDYHGKRGMNLIESANNPSLGKDATKAIIRILEVGLDLAKMKNHPMTLHELNKLIDDISEIRDTIVSSGDFAITEDLEDNGDTPSTPTTDENNGITTLLNSLIADEIEAIDGYNGAITTIKSVDGIDLNIKNNIIEVLTDIAGEENIHIGQL
jgi:hypothetical protein